MINKCNWTENSTTFVQNDNPNVVNVEEKLIVVECKNNDTKQDLDNVNIRYFCKKHMIEVKRIRKIMHKNCLSRGKLLHLLNLEYKYTISKDRKRVWVYLINKIENGEFEYE